MPKESPKLSSAVKPWYSLDTGNLALFLGTLAAMSALVQLVLGADPFCVVIAVITCFMGVFGFVVLGAYNLGSWVVLAYVLGNVLLALLAKTVLGQPLDSYLSAPVTSFLVLLICVGGQVVALLLVRHLPTGKPLFAGNKDLRYLTFLSWVCFWLGAIFWVLNRWMQGPGQSGFGGLAVFRDLLVMAVIARSAMLLLRGGSRWNLDGWLVFMLASAMLMGLLDNQKTAAALPVAGHILTLLFFRRGLPWRSIVLLLVGGVMFVALLSPIIHALRAMGQQQLGLGERVEFVVKNVQDLAVNPGRLGEFEELAAAQFEGGYYNYFGDEGKGQMLLGRFASVQQIDPVIAEVDRAKPQGGDAIWPAFARLVPSFFLPQKPEYIEAYHTLVHYRLIDPKGGKFPTLPLAGQSYAAYGWLGVALIPFFTFVVFFIVVKKLGWHLYQNVYAIFFLCSFVIVYANQGDFGQYAGAVLRNFPLFAVVFWFIQRLYKLRLVRRAPAGSQGQTAPITRALRT